MAKRRWLSGRRRSSRHDVAALALLVAAISIAAIGAYLLVVVAVIFVGWLLHVATRRIADPIVVMPASVPPTTQHAPVAPYRAVAIIEPAVFADPDATRTAASRVFEAWVAGLPSAPARSIDLVRAIEAPRWRSIGRLETALELRRVREHCAPAPGKQVIGAPPLDKGSIDPWSPPANLGQVSRFIAACRTCSATGRVACAACHGQARVECTRCHGSGKYEGVTANGAHRTLNCKTCRGKGSVVCEGCTRGKIACPTCEQAKQLACWLEIESTTRHDVQTEPAGAATRAFVWAQDGARAAQPAIELDARIVEVVQQPRALAISELSSRIDADWRTESWPRIQPRLAAGERVRWQTLTFLAVPQVSVSYAVGGAQQTVSFEGLRMLAPPPRRDELFARRGRMLGRLRLALALLPVSAAIVYVARGDYFTAGRGAGIVAGLVSAAAMTALIAYRALWNATLGRRRARGWALAAIAPLAIVSALAVLGEPSAGRAEDLIAAGQLDAAAVELQAAHVDGAQAAWADLHLARSLAATTCAAATAEFQEAPPAQRQAAQQHADQLASAEAARALDAGDAERADTARICGSAGVREDRALQARIAARRRRHCLETRDWACALQQSGMTADPVAARSEVLTKLLAEADALMVAAHAEPALEHKLDHERAAERLWLVYLTERPVQKAFEDLRNVIARDEAALAIQQGRQRARDEAEAKRQLAAAARERRQLELAAERERRQQEAAAERERRREAASSSGGLMCNDGTLSPSCTCGGPHRGCCSWHGGIAGCQ